MHISKAINMIINFSKQSFINFAEDVKRTGTTPDGGADHNAGGNADRPMSYALQRSKKS